MHNHVSTQHPAPAPSVRSRSDGCRHPRCARTDCRNRQCARESSRHHLLSNALDEIIGLAVEQRLAECEARKAAFCSVIAPVMADSFNAADPETDSPVTVSASINANQQITRAHDQARNGVRPRPEEERLVRAAIYACSQVSARRVIVASPNDEDSAAILVELQLAVRAIEPRFTETEGGEL